MGDFDDPVMLRRVVDSIPALIGYWDADRRNVHANMAYLGFFGTMPDQVHGMHMRDVLGVELYETVRPRVDAALSGVRQQFDQTWIEPSGAVLVFQVSYVPDVVDGAVVGFFVHLVDITARIYAERARDKAITLFETTMDHAPIGKAVTTSSGAWLQLNSSMCALLGYTSDELRSMSLRGLTHPDDLAQTDEDTRQLVDGTVDKVESEKRYIRKDGSVVWVERNMVIVRAGVGDTDDDVIIVQVQDITRRKDAESALARQAVTDALTGLGNRHFLMQEIALLSEKGDRGVGLLFFDIDDFKAVNDTYGHAAGDELLVGVAGRMRAALIPGDTACRVGGDEFVVVTSTADRSILEDYRVALKQAVSGDYVLSSTPRAVRVSVSVGVSGTGGGDHVGLLRSADRHMYRDKLTSRSVRDPGTSAPERDSVTS